MGNSDKVADNFSTWLKSALVEIGWTQKQLAEAAGVSTSSMSELSQGKQALTAETAEKIAAVPELKTTKEELLVIAGAWSTPIETSKRAKAIAALDGLSDVELDLVMDFAAMLRQRERRQRRNN